MKTILSAVAMLALMTGGAMAQSTATTPPGVECHRTPPYQPGSANGSSGATHENFVQGNCEALVLPNGHTEIQNGPSASGNGGTASPHEGGHGAAGGSAGAGAGGAGGGGAGQ